MELCRENARYQNLYNDLKKDHFMVILKIKNIKDILQKVKEDTQGKFIRKK